MGKPVSLVTQMVKSLPAMQEMGVQSMGREDPLEKGTATHSSILAWEIPWTEEPGGHEFTFTFDFVSIQPSLLLLLPEETHVLGSLLGYQG